MEPAAKRAKTDGQDIVKFNVGGQRHEVALLFGTRQTDCIPPPEMWHSEANSRYGVGSLKGILRKIFEACWILASQTEVIQAIEAL